MLTAAGTFAGAAAPTSAGFTDAAADCAATRRASKNEASSAALQALYVANRNQRRLAAVRHAAPKRCLPESGAKYVAAADPAALRVKPRARSARACSLWESCRSPVCSASEGPRLLALAPRVLLRRPHLARRLAEPAASSFDRGGCAGPPSCAQCSPAPRRTGQTLAVARRGT